MCRPSGTRDNPRRAIFSGDVSTTFCPRKRIVPLLGATPPAIAASRDDLRWTRQRRQPMQFALTMKIGEVGDTTNARSINKSTID